MADKVPVQIWDDFHCTGCNCKIGQRIRYADGSEEMTCDVNIDCFGFVMGKPSYEVEVYNRDDDENNLAAIRLLDDMALARAEPNERWP